MIIIKRGGKKKCLIFQSHRILGMSFSHLRDLSVGRTKKQIWHRFQSGFFITGFQRVLIFKQRDIIRYQRQSCTKKDLENVGRHYIGNKRVRSVEDLKRDLKYVDRI